MGGKKKSAQQRAETQRKLRARTSTKSASMRNPGHDAPPPEAVEAYIEAYQWAAQNPDAAADLASYVESDWAGPMAGLAFPERFNHPEDQVQWVAWSFRAWHILHGFQFSLDWPTPIAVMSVDQIIEQLQADGKAGKIAMAEE